MKSNELMNTIYNTWQDYLADPNWYIPEDTPTFENFMEWWKYQN